MKNTCVQCNKQMEFSIDSQVLDKTILVCANPECANFGLLAISLESINKALKNHSLQNKG